MPRVSALITRWGVLAFAALVSGCAGSHPHPQPVRRTVVTPVKQAAPVHPARPKLICWMADGSEMHPTGELEGFLADRLGASGDRVVIEPVAAHGYLRTLGLDQSSQFDPEAAQRLALGAGADWVVWVKLVSRDVQPKKLFSIPYLFSHRRLDAHVFFDVRVYDAVRDSLVGSKRLQLADKGEATWQAVEDEPLDPAYNNDPVEIHERMRKLDWRAAAAISGYCSDLWQQTHRPVPARSARRTSDPDGTTSTIGDGSDHR